MNAIETPQNHADQLANPASGEAAYAAAPLPSPAPEVKIVPPRRNRNALAIALGVIGVVGSIMLVYWRRSDLERIFGEFLPYAQILGSLVLWVGILRLKDWSAYKTHRARLSLMTVAIVTATLAGMNIAHERRESAKRTQAVERLFDRLRQIETKVEDNAASAGRSIGDLSSEVKGLRNKIKPEEMNAKMTGLNATMERVLNPSRAMMAFTFAPYADPLISGDPITPVRDIALPLQPDGSVHIRFALINNSDVVAETLQVIFEICLGCRYAREPQGFTRIPGSHETERNHIYGDAPARGAVGELAVDVIPPPGVPTFDVRIRYRCKTCVIERTGTVGRVHIQRN